MSGQLLSKDVAAVYEELRGPQLTDEEWKVRDATIQADRNKRSAGDTASALNEIRRHRAQLDEWGMHRVPTEHYDRMVHRRQLVAWGVPVDVVAAVEMDSLSSWPPLIAARQFEHQIKRKAVLVLEGANETGKSTAAAWWVAQPGPVLPYLDGGERAIHPPRFVTASDFERMGKFSDKRIESVYMARRLVLDDLGINGRYPDMIRRLVALIGHRVAMRLPMVITSNLAQTEWSEIFQGHNGGHIFSRLDRCAIWWTAAR